jgi:two-component system, cell cycle response regulator
VLKKISLLPCEGLSGTAWITARTTAATDRESGLSELPVGIRERYRCGLSVPLASGTDVFGTITLFSEAKPRFGSEDQRLLELIAPEAAVALRNARSYDASRETDSLTGLPNAHFMFLQVQKEVARARRTGRPFGIAVLDLDRFKPINDTYGHKVGDEVLRILASRIKGRLRGTDTVCRWGGDEFVALLPETDGMQVEVVARDLQRFVDDLDIPVLSGTIVRAGLSVGWAVFPEDGRDHDELIRVADKRMYRDKARRHLSAGATVTAERPS